MANSANPVKVYSPTYKYDDGFHCVLVRYKGQTSFRILLANENTDLSINTTFLLAEPAQSDDWSTVPAQIPIDSSEEYQIVLETKDHGTISINKVCLVGNREICEILSPFQQYQPETGIQFLPKMSKVFSSDGSKFTTFHAIIIGSSIGGFLFTVFLTVIACKARNCKAKESLTNGKHQNDPISDTDYIALSGITDDFEENMDFTLATVSSNPGSASLVDSLLCLDFETENQSHLYDYVEGISRPATPIPTHFKTETIPIIHSRTEL